MRVKRLIWLLAGACFGVLIAIALSAPTLERNFPRPILAPYVLAHEGGYSNHPSDTGGVTLEGVIQRVYDAYRDEKGRPRRALTPELRATSGWITERNEIYQTRYWLPIAGDKLPAGVDYATFDYAVNSGIGRGGRELRRALNLPMDDWRVTPEVLIQVRRTHTPSLINDIFDQRERFLQGICTARPSQCVFLNGWMNRTHTGRAIAFRLHDPRMGGLVPPLQSLAPTPARPMGKAFEEAEGDQP